MIHLSFSKLALNNRETRRESMLHHRLVLYQHNDCLLLYHPHLHHLLDHLLHLLHHSPTSLLCCCSLLQVLCPCLLLLSFLMTFLSMTLYLTTWLLSFPPSYQSRDWNSNNNNKRRNSLRILQSSCSLQTKVLACQHHKD